MVGGDAARGADLDAGGEDGVGPAAVQGAAVELVVDGGDGVGVDALVELPLPRDEPVADGFGQGVEVAGVVGGEVLQAELGVLHGRERWRAGEPVELLARRRGGARSRSRKTSAPDCPEPMTVMWSAAQQPLAVGEVVGGVDDGDGRGVGEGLQRFGDVGLGADAEDEVAGVGAAEGLGLAVGVELGEVDLEQRRVRGSSGRRRPGGRSGGRGGCSPTQRQ